jgi:hypothetical protein
MTQLFQLHKSASHTISPDTGSDFMVGGKCAAAQYIELDEDDFYQFVYLMLPKSLGLHN